MHAKHVRNIYTPKSIFAYQYHEFSFLFGVLFTRIFMRPARILVPQIYIKIRNVALATSWKKFKFKVYFYIVFYFILFYLFLLFQIMFLF